MRLRDATHPDQVNTPVRRVCYAAQLVLSGDMEPDQARQQLLRRVEELSQVFTDADSRRVLSEATQALLDQQFYKCLKALRALLPREERLMAYQ